MKFPENLRYTKDHEWVKIEGTTATMGITEFAQSELGDIVFVDLPPVGKALKQGDTACVVESTKAASDVYAPLSGKVSAVNKALSDAPDAVNKSPYESGWMLKLEGVSADAAAGLMSAADYTKLINK